MNNLLIKGDNLDGLRYLLDNGLEGKVDLIYIDPPFATGGTFSIDTGGRVATISKSNDSQIAYTDNLKGEEYISFLRTRVKLMYKLLSDRGSFYLHIDYKIGHYVKVMLDEIFGFDNFRNDITRIKCNPKIFPKIGFGNIKDMILFYTKGENPIWNNPTFEYTEDELKKIYNKKDSKGRRYTTVPIHAPGETKSKVEPFRGIYPPKGRHWRTSVAELNRLDDEGLIEWSSSGNPRKINYADERVGKKPQDIWDFKDPQYPIYPTQKNEQMLQFIINASSQEDSLVLDCFAGSGTTLKAANRLNRHWIGIDQSDVAIQIIKKNLEEDGLFSSKYDFVTL